MNFFKLGNTVAQVKKNTVVPRKSHAVFSYTSEQMLTIYTWMCFKKGRLDTSTKHLGSKCHEETEVFKKIPIQWHLLHTTQFPAQEAKVIGKRILECSEQSFCGTPKKNYPNFKVRAAEEKRDQANLITVSHFKAETGSN